MPLKIVREDIYKMNTEAIVCEDSIASGAGLLEFGKSEAEVFVTQGNNLPAKYIIHVNSPSYTDGESGEESKLRLCYRKSLELAAAKEIKSVAFPIIAAGSAGYPVVDAMNIAVDEINGFLSETNLDVILVPFENKSLKSYDKLYRKLKEYIEHNYVSAKPTEDSALKRRFKAAFDGRCKGAAPKESALMPPVLMNSAPMYDSLMETDSLCDQEEFDVNSFDERTFHIEDPFGTYVHYLLKSRGMKPKEVQDRGWISKHVFTKINKNPETYQPAKITAFQLCIGFGLNIDESIDFLAKAGYTFSPSMKEDLIWKFGIENGLDIYDISDLLEKYGYAAVVDF